MTFKSTQEPLTSKLGTFKHTERARIWVEGSRLKVAGFTVGAFYAREITEGTNPKILMTLLSEDDVIAAPPLKVSGKGSHPIIDITGKRIAKVFGSRYSHVVVWYGDGEIMITGAELASESN